LLLGRGCGRLLNENGMPRLAAALILHRPCDRLRLVKHAGDRCNDQGGNSVSYIEKTLVPGETVVYQTRLHWVVMLWHIVISVILLEVPALALLFYAFRHEQQLEPRALHLMQGGGIALLLISGIVIAVGAIRRNATEMAVTNRRVVVKTGLVTRKTIEMLLNKIESIEVNESGMGRVLGYGSITLIGTGGTSEPFQLMAKPLEFRNQVQQQIEGRSGALNSPSA
jgi:Bacterial PH domain